jgi:signal transduction histidine kinase
MSPDPPPNLSLTLTEQELFRRLGWFTQVRWGATACAAVFMAVGWYGFDVRFDWQAGLAVVAAMLAYNLLLWTEVRRLYRQPEIRRRRIVRLAHTQIICDLLAVTALVHTIGGVENHFIILFIFPMIVASEFFRVRVALLYATAAAALINLMGWGEYFFYDALHCPLSVCVGGDTGQCVPLVAAGEAHRGIFVLQVCFVMTFAVYVTVFVAASIAGRLRRREEELERAHRDLQSLEQLKSQFMRKTSHELRAPIGAVQSLLKAAEAQIPTGAAGHDLLDRAVARSESMLDLIDDLLRYSRLQGAGGPEHREPVDLAEILRGAADLFRAQANEKAIRLEIRPGAAPLVGAREGLMELVDNLLSNAVRYTPRSGTVTAETTRDGSGVRLTVSDTGIGITPEDLPHIFDEFFRSEAAKLTVAHGTGLGMAIAKRVVDLHGGRIEVESRPGQGTTFRVTLPGA